MSVTTHTNEAMKMLPAGLRPNPYNLEEPLLKALATGWTVKDYITSIMADRPKEPGHIIAAARRIAETPSPQTNTPKLTYPDNHCRNTQNTGCPCNHDTDPTTGVRCYKGWLEGNDIPTDKAFPCPTCRPASYTKVNA